MSERFQSVATGEVRFEYGVCCFLRDAKRCDRNVSETASRMFLRDNSTD